MHKKILFIILILLMTCAFLVTPADEKKPQKAKKDKEAKKEKKDKSKKKLEYPPMKKFIKGLEKQEGFYTIFHKDEKVYASIKKSQLNQLFLMAFSISGGPQFTGWQWNHILVKWEQVENNLLLLRPNFKHRADEKTLIGEILKKTYTDSIILSVGISCIEGDNILIDCNQIFKKDLAQMGLLINWVLGGSAVLNSQLSSWSKIKVFSDNIEMEIKAVFTGGSDFMSNLLARYRGLVADSRGVRIHIHYSISKLPKSDYKPRRADDRIGYFLNVHKNYSKPYHSKTKFVRQIQRWNLQKADTSLDLSPPKKPIIFYIEKTVPVRFRYYVKQGILEWNKAFEKIGIVDAIIVRQQTENEFADLDPEDTRYNFFRWIASGSAYAMGPSRSNPITGEIFDADIVFDDDITRYSHREYRMWGPSNLARMIDSRTYGQLKRLPVFQRLFAQTPVQSNLPLFPWPKLFKHPLWQSRWGIPFGHCCQYAYGMKSQLALAAMIFQTRNQGNGKLPEKYLGDIIKDLVTHEVGHTLGLRHNFKASSWLKLSEINSKNPPAITSASVMDYNPVNFAAKGQPQGSYQTAGIGPYDYWAIAYGYGFPGKGETEDKMLKKITDQVANPDHIFASDEESFLVDPDPLVARWDMGHDLLEFAANQRALFDELRDNLLTRMVEKGESYSEARRAFEIMSWNLTYSSLIAIRYIGGEYFHRDHKGDPKGRPPFVVVDAALQKKALKFLAEQVLASKNFHFSPKLIEHLAPGRWNHWDSDNYDMWLPYPIHQEILSAQFLPLLVIFGPWTLERIRDMQLQVPDGQDLVSVPDVVATITDAVFAELADKQLQGQKFSRRCPFIDSIRRGLQQEYLQLLFFIGTSQVGTMFYSADVCSVVNMQLRSLLEKIDGVLGQKLQLDKSSIAHLLECKRRIDKALFDYKSQ